MEVTLPMGAWAACTSQHEHVHWIVFTSYDDVIVEYGPLLRKLFVISKCYYGH